MAEVIKYNQYRWYTLQVRTMRTNGEW